MCSRLNDVNIHSNKVLKHFVLKRSSVFEGFFFPNCGLFDSQTNKLNQILKEQMCY